MGSGKHTKILHGETESTLATETRASRRGRKKKNEKSAPQGKKVKEEPSLGLSISPGPQQKSADIDLKIQIKTAVSANTQFLSELTTKSENDCDD